MARWMVPALLALGAWSGASAAQVSLATASSTVQVGSSFEVRVHLSGLTSATADSLSAFDFGVGFDSAAVSYTGFDFIDGATGQNQLDFTEAGSFGFLGDVTSGGAGQLSAFGLSGNSAPVLDSQQADEFDMLRLFFTADTVASGVEILLDLSTSLAPFIDSNADLLAVTQGITQLSLDIVQGGGTVPEPTTLALGVLAFGLLGASRRRARAVPLLAALALPALALAGPPAAAPALAQAAAPASLGVVVEAVGQRFKVRDATGATRWYTARTPLPAQVVNKRVSGVPRPMGDAVAVDQIRFD